MIYDQTLPDLFNYNGTATMKYLKIKESSSFTQTLILCHLYCTT